MLYLALEMVSITSYVMVGYLKGDRLSNEASLKYVLFGAGLDRLDALRPVAALRAHGHHVAARDPGVPGGRHPDANRFAVYALTLLVLAGFGFKIAAVPFHFWCPDVYQGAPTPVTRLLSVLPKAAGLAIALRFFYGAFSSRSAALGPLRLDRLDVAADARLGADDDARQRRGLTQTNMKRLLAYSSIAHAGFLLMGIVALSENGAARAASCTWPPTW
jgi:NADH-quinone oxidoreductase subunit N